MVDCGLGVSLLPDWPSLWTGGMKLARIPLPGRSPVRRIGIMLALQGPCVPLARALLREAQGLAQERGGPAAREAGVQ
jgi:hypothetical protein